MIILPNNCDFLIFACPFIKYPKDKTESMHFIYWNLDIPIFITFLESDYVSDTLLNSTSQYDNIFDKNL